MRRCYRGVALVLGGILMTGFTSFNSCSVGTLKVYAAEDALTEELETAFQEDVQTGEENVETEIPVEETAEQPVEEPVPEEPAAEEPIAEEPVAEEPVAEEPVAEEPSAEEPVSEEPAVEETAIEPTPEEPAEEPVEAAGSSFGLEEQEYQVLLKIVEAEAGGEDTTGKMLVANVVMNRVRSGYFPNTVSEVVYQKNDGKAQFSPTVDGRIDQVCVSPDTVEAVARVLNGEDLSAGALYFKSIHSSSGWFDRSLNRVLEHGNHIFYVM